MFKKIKPIEDTRTFIVLKKIRTSPSKPQKYEAVSRNIVGHDRADTIMRVAKDQDSKSEYIILQVSD